MSDEGERHDQQELLSLGLLKRTKRSGEDWFDVSFSQVAGPKPIYHSFDTRNQEMAAIASHLKHLIECDGISAADICVIYNGRLFKATRVTRHHRHGILGL